MQVTIATLFELIIYFPIITQQTVELETMKSIHRDIYSTLNKFVKNSINPK